MTPPPGLKEALRVTPIAVLGSVEDIMFVLESEEAVRELQPDFSAIERLECRGIIVTSRGSQSDFVSRFFDVRSFVEQQFGRPVPGGAARA